MNIKSQSHSLTLVQGHSDSTFSNLFFLETALPTAAKFYVAPPWYGRNESLIKRSRSHDQDGRHAHVW